MLRKLILRLLADLFKLKHENIFSREDDIEKELEMIASGQAPAEEEKSDKPKTKGKKERKNREDK